MAYHDIGDPFREKGLKDTRIGLRYESGSGRGGQDIGKGVRWTKPRSLDRRTPSEYRCIRRWIEWRVEGMLPAHIIRDRCFQFGSEVGVDIVPESAYRAVHRSPEKKPRRRQVSGPVHAD